MTTEPTLQHHERRELVREHVRARVARIQRAYRADTSEGRAAVAQLRGALQTPIGADPDAYRVAFEGAESAMLGRNDLPSWEERAIHLAMGLYGLHQQSRRDADMHEKSWTLGRAVARLARPDDAESREKPVMRRFAALLTATEFTEIAHHLRGIVQQLRAARIPLDYGQLAADLFDAQSPYSRDGVRLRWSRDSLARVTSSDKSADDASPAGSAPTQTSTD